MTVEYNYKVVINHLVISEEENKLVKSLRYNCLQRNCFMFLLSRMLGVKHV